MDIWFGKHPKLEREFQQLVARENNDSNTAKSSDYFICDIEYAEECRFDLIGVFWPSSGPDRQRTENLKLAIFEMKYGKDAIHNTNHKSDIVNHVEDLNKFLEKKEAVEKFRKGMVTVFNQLIDLGLINNQNKIKSFVEEMEYILLLSSYDPDSTLLLSALDQMEMVKKVELKFAVSNFMGYGLFQENIYSARDFVEKYRSSIYSKMTDADYNKLIKKFI